MKKRGQAEIALALGLLIIMGSSIFVGYQLISEQRYIGETITKRYYDLQKCDITELPQENIISFKTFDEVQQHGYMPAKCAA